MLTNHHILMDGWSMPVLVAGAAHALCAAWRCRGAAAADALSRLSGLDCRPGSRRGAGGVAGCLGRSAGGDACWRRAIARRTPVAPEQTTLALSARLTAALSEQARRQGLTLNSMLQAAWAVLLGRLLGREDVVFGVTVAGRAPELPGIESMVGLFINTLPLRVEAVGAHAVARAAAAGAGQPAGADGAPACRACRGAGAGRIGRAVRHFGGVRELSAGPRAAGGAGGRSSADRDGGAGCDALPVEPCGDAGRAAAAAVQLPARPVRACQH